MILSGAAKRYAVALFNASVKQDITEQVNDDLSSFTALLEKNVDFHSFLLSPQILTEHKRQLIVDALGERSAGLFVRFLLLLIDKNRMQYVVEIAQAYTLPPESTGSLNRAAINDSRRNRSRYPGSVARSAGSTLIATSRQMDWSRALNTWPMPPSPINSSSR